MTSLHDLKWHTWTTWYCNTKVFGRHLPFWGAVQWLEHEACNRYERKQGWDV